MALMDVVFCVSHMSLTSKSIAASALVIRHSNRGRWSGSFGLSLLSRSAQGADIFPSPRLVLLDLKLPKVDGLEVLRTIRADERVILTSSKEQKDRRL